MELAYIVIATVCPVVVVVILIVTITLLMIVRRKRKSREKCARLRGLTINKDRCSESSEVCQEVLVRRLTRQITINGAGEPSEILKVDGKKDGPEIRGGLVPVAIYVNPQDPRPPNA